LGRARHRRHWFDALALDRHQQLQAVIIHRLLSIDTAQHHAERLDIGRKLRFTFLTRSPVHSGPDADQDESEYRILRLLPYINTRCPIL
jgi:hypothetical protein